MVSKCNRTKSLVFVRLCVFAIMLNRNGKDKGSVYIMSSLNFFFLRKKHTIWFFSGSEEGQIVDIRKVCPIRTHLVIALKYKGYSHFLARCETLIRKTLVGVFFLVIFRT